LIYIKKTKPDQHYGGIKFSIPVRIAWS